MANDRDTTTAVVLAAGKGSRLRASMGTGLLAKPATPVAGMPLLVRTLRTLAQEGVERAIVVTGWEAAAVERCVLSAEALKRIEIRFVRNGWWELQNGVSVLAARALAGDAPFFLTMADHVYSGSVVAALRAARFEGVDAVLAVERAIEAVRDLDDATRVQTGPGGFIRAIGKHLEPFDAVDTGVFLCRPALFDALEAERTCRGGDCSLSDGIRRLARAGRALTADIPADAWWYDVDTLADLQLAERGLAGTLRRAS
jgi:choline kinase